MQSNKFKELNLTDVDEKGFEFPQSTDKGPGAVCNTQTGSATNAGSWQCQALNAVEFCQWSTHYRATKTATAFKTGYLQSKSMQL